MTAWAILGAQTVIGVQTVVGVRAAVESGCQDNLAVRGNRNIENFFWNEKCEQQINQNLG